MKNVYSSAFETCSSFCYPKTRTFDSSYHTQFNRRGVYVAQHMVDIIAFHHEKLQNKVLTCRVKLYNSESVRQKKQGEIIAHTGVTAH